MHRLILRALNQLCKRLVDGKHCEKVQTAEELIDRAHKKPFQILRTLHSLALVISSCGQVFSLQDMTALHVVFSNFIV